MDAPAVKPPLLPASLGRLGDVILLVKPGITSMVLVATAFGYLLAGRGGADWLHLAGVLMATLLVGGGGNALNQYLERDTDRLMARTRNRPLPAQRLRPGVALWGGLGAGALGLICLLALANRWAAGVGLLVMVTYVLCYTPLKRVTVLNTLVGAIPGALPPVLGWVAAGGSLGRPVLALFMILYVWQLPHFLAIAWRYRGDYAAAGLPMLPVSDALGTRTRRQLLVYSLTLVPVSLYPTVIGLSGTLYFYSAMTLSVLFLAIAARMVLRPTEAAATLLFRASLLYLPLLLLIMFLDATPSFSWHP